MTGCTSPSVSHFFPGWSRYDGAALDAGALGCVLSGAGPSLLAAVEGSGEAVARAMERALVGGGRARSRLGAPR